MVVRVHCPYNTCSSSYQQLPDRFHLDLQVVLLTVVVHTYQQPDEFLVGNVQYLAHTYLLVLFYDFLMGNGPKCLLPHHQKWVEK
jgi:hypothetical protein